MALDRRARHEEADAAYAKEEEAEEEEGEGEKDKCALAQGENHSSSDTCAAATARQLLEAPPTLPQWTRGPKQSHETTEGSWCTRQGRGWE